MSDSKTVMSNPPTYQRRNRRLWLTPDGQPVTGVTTAPVAVKEVELAVPAEPKQQLVAWNAYVIDVGTGEEIHTYPHLEGEDTVRADTSDQSKADIASVYVAKISFVDGTTVNSTDVKALKDNLNAGIWDVVVFKKDVVAAS